MMGMAFEQSGRAAAIPGFLFDMNKFFQQLLSRFLHDNLTSAVLDEHVTRGVFAFADGGNPKKRTPPAPRPDFALLRGKDLVGFLDAKYRDIWERGLPPEWLYQLSIYALASPDRTSVLLYPTTHDEACDEKIEVRQPFGFADGRSAVVIVRPVFMKNLADLVHPNQVATCAHERRKFAEYLVSPFR
jgi:5-methylcytosine-specific restriction enzyme subunit McrC